ncbi:hydroperoxide isomerase ALOXE3-like protein [Willisornis vidua]|uniref:Hydroperoxide isomerase ALOXE3-like protein n=1 Tax=Willisornis vidua TaxID=1566151 RepID=A0ABQ9DZI6_9PASS|nr:hydroperoxide isomerase ALOXE3-like protein [Willisornis vidua]
MLEHKRIQIGFTSFSKQMYTQETMSQMEADLQGHFGTLGASRAVEGLETKGRRDHSCLQCSQYTSVPSRGSGITHEGLQLVVQRGLEQVTYTSLCLPDDIQHRGMSHIPNYHYRDDGMSLWEAIESFVTGIVKFYYSADVAVSGDTELQAWVMDIFTNGFLGRTSSGVPSSLQTVAELIKFLTMVMFTCSAQHAAVNNGQYDLGAFMPNAPSSMRHPPPREKGRAFLQHFLDTLPEVATTAKILVTLILLSSQLKDRRLLGQYPEEWFTEAEPRRLIRAFQGRLGEIQEEIEERNYVAELRYNYLNPQETENSISI